MTASQLSFLLGLLEMSNANVEWRMPNGPMSPDGSCHVAIRYQYIIGLPDPGPPDDVMSQRYTIHIGRGQKN